MRQKGWKKNAYEKRESKMVLLRGRFYRRQFVYFCRILIYNLRVKVY